MGLLIRAERPGDPAEVAAIRAIVRRAFGQEDEADLLDALRADPAWMPYLALVALLGPPPGGPVMGHIAGTRLDVGGGAAVALAPLAVDPENQGRGVGTALVEAQLAAARALGERLVVVLGDPAYYSRFGFQAARELGISGPYDDAGDAFQALPLTDGPVVSGWATYAAPFGG